MGNNETVKISLSMGGGGIKQVVSDNKQSLFSVDINKNTDIVFFTPDMGRAEKDDYFIPNLHNGIFRISAYLAQYNIKNIMVCTDVDNMDQIWRSISNYKPPFVCFSPYYDTMGKDLLNISKVKYASPDSIIIAGGFEVSLNEQWLNLDNLLDIIILGEGEAKVLHLLKLYKKYYTQNSLFNKNEFKIWLESRLNQENIDGIYMFGNNKVIYHSPLADRVSNEFYQEINLNAFERKLDTSPFRKYWEISRLFFGGEKDSYFRFVSSDHCPYKCIFCQSSIYYSSIMGKKHVKVRCISSDNILSIIKSVSDTYEFVNHIYIDDENFIIFRKRAIETCNLIIEAKKSGLIRSNLKFLCRTRADNIDDEICEKLKKADFETVSIGSESYSLTELKYMRKNTTPEININAIKTILKSGLKVAENYILFSPATTIETFYESAVIICRNIDVYNVDGAATLFLTPLPGTDLWKNNDLEVVYDFPFKKTLFADKVMLKSIDDEYDYIGTLVSIPDSNLTLPHPEITLINDPYMRNISLKSVLFLKDSIEFLQKKRQNPTGFSRQFITLANLYSVVNLVSTTEKNKKWTQLKEYIVSIVKKI